VAISRGADPVNPSEGVAVGGVVGAGGSIMEIELVAQL